MHDQLRVAEFSTQSRASAIQRFKTHTFDVLIIGGGITGAGVARDAVSRGMSVALVEASDFASGTSSKSTKLIHGGLRYLENFEFGLVFEALAERAFLLKSAPHMVRPLPFYFPVYQGDLHGRAVLGLGLWLYDLLALFRTPEFHKSISRKKLIQEIPVLKSEGLKGGFKYYDASMWDDVLAVETLRAARQGGAAIANYVRAISPLWSGDQISGFKAEDRETGMQFEIRAKKVIICAGPWTDLMGEELSEDWKPWLMPSKGAHFVFDLKRIPIPGALVMSHPQDGRISFVVPRPDLGAGVVIAGTTDGPSPKDPSEVQIEKDEVNYIMGLMQRYFPTLGLTSADILSAYVGIRPLVGAQEGGALQKVSREHHIDQGPGGTVIVAGGKYTTHRKMAEEIVDFAMKHSAQLRKAKSQTRTPVNPLATWPAVEQAKQQAQKIGLVISPLLFQRYGAEALEIAKIHQQLSEKSLVGRDDPEGFPMIGAQLVFGIRTGMVVHLEDFYLRRMPLYMARSDHGLPWAQELAAVMADELGLPIGAQEKEVARLRAEISRRESWRL